MQKEIKVISAENTHYQKEVTEARLVAAQNLELKASLAKATQMALESEKKKAASDAEIIRLLAQVKELSFEQKLTRVHSKSVLDTPKKTTKVNFDETFRSVKTLLS